VSNSRSNLLILDIDLENRPLSYLGQDYTTAEITAIACCWHGRPERMRCWLLGRDTPIGMLEGFREYYDQADMVTGHYIRMHDLPIINGAMIEHGLPPLMEKLTCDTKLDLVKKGQSFSASQENLAAMFGITAPKVHMNTPMWREANRLTPEGLRLTKERVTGDVLQHMALREVLVERGLLGDPKVWKP
jgi:hypothetical protein